MAYVSFTSADLLCCIIILFRLCSRPNNTTNSDLKHQDFVLLRFHLHICINPHNYELSVSSLNTKFPNNNSPSVTQGKPLLEEQYNSNNTWSQSSSSMVPLMFLKNSVNWPPFFLSASDAATPAYMSTAGVVSAERHVNLHKHNTPITVRKTYTWHDKNYLEDWTHILLGMPSQNFSQQGFLQFHIFSCI